MESFITEVLNFAVVGALCSLALEIITKKLSTFTSKVATVALSLVAGAIIMFFYDSSYTESFLSALGAASTVYAFIIKKPSTEK